MNVTKIIKISSYKDDFIKTNVNVLPQDMNCVLLRSK